MDRHYKRPTIRSAQDRKRDFLSDQKLKRQAQVELARQLSRLHQDQPSVPIAYKSELMLSCGDWNTFAGMNHLQDCIFVPVPAGDRVMTISSRGKTSSHALDRPFVHSFKSMLPGGSYASLTPTQDKYCILDAIYQPYQKRYWILDMMCWNGNPIFDCDAEFRFYWLYTHLPPLPIQTMALANEACMEILPRFGSKDAGLLAAMQDSTVEGVYVYLKSGHYDAGQSCSEFVYLSRQQFHHIAC